MKKKTKKNRIVIQAISTAFILSILAVSGGCGKKPVSNDTSTSASSTNSETQATQSNSGQSNTTQSGSSSLSAAANGPTGGDLMVNSNDVVKELPASAKGYSVKQVNGITYVNGILIANKTYSLPASYDPQGLYDEVVKAFNVMKADAAKQGLNIYIASGYRTYQRQEYLYNNYVKQDGKTAADTYSARAGYSEHQSGYSFDLNSIDESFTNTPEGKWVAENAHKYGFIIRFPKGKEAITGYMYESWHLRYLGTELAEAIYNSGLCLEEYLGINSVYKD